MCVRSFRHLPRSQEEVADDEQAEQIGDANDQILVRADSSECRSRRPRNFTVLNERKSGRTKARLCIATFSTLSIDWMSWVPNAFRQRRHLIHLRDDAVQRFERPAAHLFADRDIDKELPEES